MNCETLEHARDHSPMVLVAGGPFRAGLPVTDFLAEEHEKPQRQVSLTTFWIDVYPITNSRFNLFL